MKKNKACNAILIPLLALLLISNFAHSQGLQNEIKKKSEISVDEKICQIKYVSMTCEKDSSKTLFEKFKEARKHNKENIKKSAKYYNPVTFIYRLFGL